MCVTVGEERASWFKACAVLSESDRNVQSLGLIRT